MGDRSFNRVRSRAAAERSLTLWWPLATCS